MAQTQPTAPRNPAEGYEQVMVKNVFGPLADETVRAHPPSNGDHVLDAACGTAIILRRAAPFVGDSGRLAGLDINPGLLALAGEIAKTEGIAVELREGRVEEMPYTDGEFDRVYCQQAMQFFTDRAVATQEMWRVLRDNGRLVISVWEGLDCHPYFRSLDAIAFEHAGIHMFADPFGMDDEDELRQLMGQAGFRDVSVEHISFTVRSSDPEGTARQQLTAATNVIPSLRALPDEDRASLIESVMEEALPTIDAFTVDGKLTVDWHSNIAIGHK